MILDDLSTSEVLKLHNCNAYSCSKCSFGNKHTKHSKLYTWQCFEEYKKARVNPPAPMEQKCSTCKGGLVAERVICYFCSLNPNIKNHWEPTPLPSAPKVKEWKWLSKTIENDFVISKNYYTENRAKLFGNLIRKIEETEREARYETH